MDLLLMISIHVWMCAYSTTSTLFIVSLLYDFYMCCTYNIFGKIWILIPYGILYYVLFCPFTNSFYECILCIILMALQWIVTGNLHDNFYMNENRSLWREVSFSHEQKYKRMRMHFCKMCIQCGNERRYLMQAIEHSVILVNTCNFLNIALFNFFFHFLFQTQIDSMLPTM